MNESTPPLKIPSNQFILYWFTDATNTDWGWKFKVHAQMAKTDLRVSPIHQLHSHLFQVESILYEAPHLEWVCERLPQQGKENNKENQQNESTLSHLIEISGEREKLEQSYTKLPSFKYVLSSSLSSTTPLNSESSISAQSEYSTGVSPTVRSSKNISNGIMLQKDIQTYGNTQKDTNNFISPRGLPHL